MSLTPTEVAKIEKLVDASRLSEIVIEQDATRIVIGGGSPVSRPVEPLTIAAPLAGTVTFEKLAIGQAFEAGDVVARLGILDAETPVTAPQAGRIAAILAADGALVGYGAALIQFEPEGPA